jgi:hypothetical protein
MAKKPTTKRLRQSSTFRWIMGAGMTYGVKAGLTRYGLADYVEGFLPGDGPVGEAVDFVAGFGGYIVDVAIPGMLAMAIKGRMVATKAIKGW